MHKLVSENTYVISRANNIQRNQLEKLAHVESRTKSSMNRCLIERGCQEFIWRKKIVEVKNGQGRISALGESK
jgi:hypothetical protein